jgi:ribosomal protein S18 acetylase RimI-like enzyme
LAKLIVSAVPEFYRLIPLGAQELLDTVAGQITMPGTECEKVAAHLDGTTPVAAICWIGLDGLRRAQNAGLAQIMRVLPRDRVTAFIANVSAYSRGVEPIAPASLPSALYLSRVAVAPEMRGRGLGREAVRHMIGQAEGRAVCLHVAAGNEPAMSLYRQLGFVPQSNEPFAARAMILSAERA